jgi:hypothetical protein
VTRNSGADKAGSQRRCYCKIDEQNISSFADLWDINKRSNKVQVTYNRDGKTKVIPVTLSKNEFFNAEFKGIELENIEAADKKNLKSNMVCESKASSQNLKQYEDELIGNIILSIDNVKRPM